VGKLEETEKNGGNILKKERKMGIGPTQGA